MKKLLFLAALGLCLGSCDNTSAPKDGQTILASTLFPAQISDTMSYADTFGDNPTTTTDSSLRDVVRVIGQIRLEGETYQVHEIDHDSVTIFEFGRIKPVKDSEYYRMDGSRIYQHREGITRSLVDFAVEHVPGKTAQEYQRVEARFVKDTTVTVAAGTFSTKLVETGELIGIRRFYAAGVGLVLMTQGKGYRRELLSARIGGRSYP